MKTNVSDLLEILDTLRKNQLRQDDYGSEYKRLWLAVIVYGIIDLQSSDRFLRKDAKEFFNSDYLRDICKQIDIDYLKLYDNLVVRSLI